MQKRRGRNSTIRCSLKSFLNERYWFPPWFKWLGFFIAFGAVSASAFFVILYSLDWGAEKSNEWLTSFLLSAGEDVFILQPLKVIFIASLLSIIFREFTQDKDPFLEHENRQMKRKNEGWFFNPSEELRELCRGSPPPALDEHIVWHFKKKREQERRLWHYIGKLIWCCIFTLLVFFIAWAATGQSVYQTNFILKKTFTPFTTKSHRFKNAVDLISRNPHQFWEYLRQIFLPEMFSSTTYAGAVLSSMSRTRFLHNFTSDLAFYRLSGSRLRQVRLDKNSPCSVPDIMNYYLHLCKPEYMWRDVDRKHYRPEWKKAQSNMNVSLLSRVQRAFTYDDDGGGADWYALLAMYEADGYIADLGDDLTQSFTLMKVLERYNWLDRYTRAIFFETTLYNPNTNLFTDMQIRFEFSETGGMFITPNINTFKLFTSSGTDMALLVAQTIYVFVLIYQIFRLCRNIQQIGFSEYFKFATHKIEAFTIGLGIVGLSMFALREIYTSILMERVRSNDGSYISFQWMSIYQQALTLCLSVIVFLTTLKLLPLLKVSHTFSIFTSALNYSAKDLLNYTVVLMALMMAFSSFGYLTFGANVNYFKSAIDTAETLLLMLLGFLDYRYMAPQLGITYQFIGMLYFGVFMFSVFIILMNIFIVLINEALCWSRAHPELSDSDHDLVNFAEEYFRKKYEGLFSMLNKRSEEVRPESFKTDEAAALFNLCQIDARLQDEAQTVFRDIYELKRNIKSSLEENERIPVRAAKSTQEQSK